MLRGTAGKQGYVRYKQVGEMSFSIPPSLRATSPISAHLRAEEEVKASSFTKVKKNGTTCHTLQYCGISLSTKDGRPYILFTSIEFYQTAIEKF